MRWKLLLFTLLGSTALLSSALPASADCCLCHPKENPTANLCLTDVSNTCDKILSANSANKGLDGVICDKKLDDATQCVKNTGSSASALCTIGPVTAAGYAPEEKIAQAPVAAISITQNIPIPGLNYAKNIYSENGEINIPYLAQYIAAAYAYLLSIGTITAAVMIVYGGFKYVMSSTVEGVRGGKENIINALTGLVVLYAAIVILQTINPAVAIPTGLKMKFVNPEQFKKDVESVGKDLPISGTPATLKADGRPDYKDLKDRSGKTGSFPSADTDGSCNPIAGVPAYDFKQYSGEWAAQSTGLLRVCSKTAIPDLPDNTSKKNEADYYNEVHDGSNKADPIQPPCCTPYSYSACGATSAAIVLAAYGEITNPGVTGEMAIQSGRTCNYGGMSPLATLKYLPDYVGNGSVPRDSTFIDTELKAGRPIIFACGNCKGADSLSQYEVNGRTLGRVIATKGYGGHFMVLTGVYSDGNYAVADPGGTMNYIKKSTILDTGKVMALYQIKRKDGKPIKACQ